MMRQLGRSSLVLMEWRSSMCEESCRLLTHARLWWDLFVVFYGKSIATICCCCSNVVGFGNDALLL